MKQGSSSDDNIFVLIEIWLGMQHKSTCNR